MKTENIISAIFVSLLFICVAIGYFTQPPIQPQFNQSDYRQHIIDSVRISDNKQKVAEIEAMQAIEEQKVLSAKKKVSFYRNEAERLKHISDSLMTEHEAELDTICREIITSKQNEIDTLNQVVNELDIEAESYSKNLYLCEKKYDLQMITDSINTNDKIRLNKQIEMLTKSNHRNWFERNKLWIGFGSGVIGTFLIVK